MDAGKLAASIIGSLEGSPTEEMHVTVLASPVTTSDIYAALREGVRAEPQPASAVVDGVVATCRVDREEVVAAMWDLVEDDGFVYDAGARIRRPA